jgi:hypothetical protein
MTAKPIDFKREGWRDTAKTLRKIADDLDAGVHPECTVGAPTLMGPKGEMTVFGLGPSATTCSVWVQCAWVSRS